jgi:hypothetical protein
MAAKAGAGEADTYFAAVFCVMHPIAKANHALAPVREEGRVILAHLLPRHKTALA